MLTDLFYRRAIITTSIAIPLVVVVLFLMPHTSFFPSIDLKFFPKFHAFLNSLATILLVCGFIAIKNRNITVHKGFMFSAFVVSSVFLGSYVFYHAQAEPTHFGGVGAIRYIYFFILITHISLAAIILPFILFTFYRSLTGDFVRHRKIARITLPLWLYITVTGVLVYVLISPYY